MGDFEALGLSINVFRPSYAVDLTAYTSTPTFIGQHMGELRERVESYSQSKGIYGGFLAASFRIVCDHVEQEMWYEDGVGAHVVVTDDVGVIVWEGFVDSLSVAMAGRTIARGPYMDIANKVLVTYTPTNTGTAPPARGTKTMSTGLNMPESQRVYGVRERIVNAGSCTDGEATQYLNMWNQDNAWPKTSVQTSVSGSDKPSVEFRCLGYWNLWKYYYRNKTNASGSITGTVNVSDKITSILAADPANIFDNTRRSIQANTIQTAAYEEEWTEAEGILKTLVGLGDASYNRAKLVVGAEQFVTYASVPTAVRYTQSVYDTMQEVLGPGREIVRPWAIEPGEWLRFTDWQIARAEPASLRSDSRTMLIEQVDYDAVWGARLQGGRSDRIDQLLAQMGLKGR